MRMINLPVIKNLAMSLYDILGRTSSSGTGGTGITLRYSYTEWMTYFYCVCLVCIYILHTLRDQPI